MSYTQPCRYKCGKKLAWKGKTGERGSTGFFEVDTKIEHTYARCDEVKKEIFLAIEKENERLASIQKKKDEHGGGLDSWS